MSQVAAAVVNPLNSSV